MTSCGDPAKQQVPITLGVPSPRPQPRPQPRHSDNEKSIMAVFASITSTHGRSTDIGVMTSALKERDLYRECNHPMLQPFRGSDDGGDRFHARLHQILSDPEATGIIEWLPHGRSWKVLDAAGLEQSRLLVRYFNRGGMSFLMKEVKAWGFRRITRGADSSAYYHQLFVRGMPGLSRHIKRRGHTLSLLQGPQTSRPSEIIPNLPSSDSKVESSLPALVYQNRMRS